MKGYCDNCGDTTEVFNVQQPDMFGGPSTTIQSCLDCLDDNQSTKSQEQRDKEFEAEEAFYEQLENSSDQHGLMYYGDEH